MKHTIKKISRVFLPTLLGLFLFGSIASAHVEVTPKTSTTGEEETYTVKVPSEKDVPTTKFTIKIPSGLDFDSFEPLAGWNFTTQKGSDGKVTSITFETTGQGILPDQFQRFVFVAKNPDKATKAAWDAYQYYKDGSVVEWTGDQGSETPHSITNIVSDTAVDQTTKQDVKQNTVSTSTGTSSLPLIISVLSALLSIVAIFLGVRKK
ncbi:YcnI family copper-binding membrane protein [Neobacillus ginsengisoli]|uniref:Uncharacterized protein YcnI n=1 Tax=Neobacillus ginsengisoli TaxID=904295 RepID=A0ABT9XUL3_9BACI|nr:DUF1775 domain-containing protein [Neobacillus ginsengisoli]MDQ0199209.1 uncharacterized protein YcnI [Neobacillus ginsengisoli]